MNNRRYAGLGMIMASILLLMAYPVEQGYSFGAMTIGELLRLSPGLIGTAVMAWPAKKS